MIRAVREVIESWRDDNEQHNNITFNANPKSKLNAKCERLSDC